MKEIKLYQCGFCHTQYKYENACKKCEENHKTKLKIFDAVYRPFKDDLSGFPIRIRVQDSKTGKIAWYVKESGNYD